MKYGVLAVSKPGQVNIGDYIQAAAAKQFLPQVDAFIEREELSDYEGDDIAMIMNAWYIHNPKKWPPSNRIHPLYVAVHINKQVYEAMSTEANLQTFKTAGIVGCRDMDTLDYFKRVDVNAYFSGCLTLTLGYKYKTQQKGNTIYFVDPAIKDCKNYYSVIKYTFLSLFYWNNLKAIFNKRCPKSGKLKHCLLLWAETACFYYTYKSLFSQKLMVDAEYISHQNADYIRDFPTNKDLIDEAERLVKLYSQAKLVVTSRIHCALPCTGLETPVLYVYDDKQSAESSCRLKGLLDLFNVIHLRRNGNLECGNVLNGLKRINKDSKIENPKNWKPLAQDLIKKCEAFIMQFSEKSV